MKKLYQCSIGCLHRMLKTAELCESKTKRQRAKELKERRKYRRLYGTNGVSSPCRNYTPGAYEGG